MKRSILDNDYFRSYLNSRILCEVETEEKRVALTFDDGPNPHHTPRILDLLAGKGLRATFFVVGRRAKRYGDLLERIAREGHEVANHTYSHVPLVLLTPAMIRGQLERAEAVIQARTGEATRFMRPPMGLFNRTVLRVSAELGYCPVIGSLNPRDSNGTDADEIVTRVLRGLAPGGIIILHDGGWRISVDRSRSIEAADRITDALLERGYAVGTLGELVTSAP